MWRSYVKNALIAALILSGMVSTSALANADLAKSKNCMACHAMDKKMVGPGFKEVAEKYKGQKDAEAKLVQKVIKGGGGVWGEMAMPPNAISEKESQELVRWVLSQK